MKVISTIVITLFLSCAVCAKEYQYKYTPNCSKAYQHFLALRPEEGKKFLKKELIANPYNLMATYIYDYNDCLLLLFNGNEVDYEQLKHHQDERLLLMDRGDESSPWHRLCKAGVYFHWAFIHLRFNEKLKAASCFRKSFILLKDNKKKFPDFPYNDLFFGIEEATVGAIPDNYAWIAALFGMKGDINNGMDKLNRFVAQHKPGDPFYEEALVYSAYTHYYLLSDKPAAWDIVSSADFATEDNLLNSFVKINIALNYRKAEVAKQLLKQAERIEGYGQYPIFKYEYGYALLHDLDDGAQEKFNSFLREYRGRIFVKDALQKLAYSYYISGNKKKALQAKERIINTSDANTDSDKQALRFAKQDQWPDIVLLKAQLLTDGGYYDKAYHVLSETAPSDYTTASHLIEYYFRMARVHEELGKTLAAVDYYTLTIEKGKDRPEQFAARSALQMGFLYEKKGNYKTAADMYSLAISMKDHDFKNSIDQQAKAGLNRLSSRKE